MCFVPACFEIIGMCLLAPKLLNISLLDAVYIKVFLKSFLIALITTAICILISYPFCIFVSKKNSYLKKIFMTLVIIPFLTNSLIRTYGIIILLRKEGINVDMPHLNGKGMKQKMQYASRLGVPYVVILGEDEVKNNLVAFKNMNTGEQVSISYEEALKILKNK